MDEGKDKKILAKVICVILSFALWFYVTNVINPTTDKTMKKISVQALNEDDLKERGLALSPGEELTVDLKVEGHFNKIKYLDSSDFTLVVDLGKYASKSGKYSIPVSIIEQPEDIVVKNKDSLKTTIKVEELMSKEFNLINNVKISYSNNYSSNNVYVEPSVVNVSGPKSLVNKVSKVVLEGDAKDISSEIEKEFSIKPYDEDGNIVTGVTLDYDKGMLSVSLNKRRSIPIKINYINNLPAGIELVNTTLSVDSVYISGENGLIDNIQEIKTEPIDLSNIYSNTTINSDLIIQDGIQVSEKAITITIEVEDTRRTSTTINDVPIEFTNKISDLEYSNATVNITLLGPKKDLDKVKIDNIKIEASVIDIIEAGDNYSVQWTANLINIDNVEIENSTGTIIINVTKKIE